MENKAEVIGVKMEWIGGLMVKIHYPEGEQPKWLIVGDHPELFDGSYVIHPAIRRALDWWMGRE